MEKECCTSLSIKVGGNVAADEYLLWGPLPLVDSMYWYSRTRIWKIITYMRLFSFKMKHEHSPRTAIVQVVLVSSSVCIAGVSQTCLLLSVLGRYLYVHVVK